MAAASVFAPTSRPPFIAEDGVHRAVIAHEILQGIHPLQEALLILFDAANVQRTIRLHHLCS